jgi:type IV secretion system protein VirD4
VLSAYVCLPAPRFPVFNRWLRLVLNAALTEMTGRLDPPAMPVRFMLDELATLGRLDAVENASGLAAGYGVQLWTVWQDLGQLKDIYKARWPTFVNNAGVRVAFSAHDLETAKYVSDMVGVGTVLVGTNDHALSVSSRGVMTPDEVMRLPDDKMLVLIAGQQPTMTERTPYWLRDDLRGAWDDPRR